MVWFRMPTTAVIHSEYIFYFVRNLYLSIVTGEDTHSSLRSDGIFPGVDKLLRRLHGVQIRNQGIFANKDLGHGDTRINGWIVRGEGVCHYSFISSGKVKSWNLDLKCFLMGNLVDVTSH